MADYWVKSGTGGTDAGTSWTNAAESLGGLMAAQAIADGDTIYVHNTHSFNSGGVTISLIFPETSPGVVRVLCVDGGDATGASLVDGTVGSLTTGALEETGGNASINIRTDGSTANALFIHGIAFRTGTGVSAGTADMNFQAGSGRTVFNECSFHINSTNGGAVMTTGTAGTLAYVEFNNCSFRFEQVGQAIQLNAGPVIFTNCSLDTAGVALTYVFDALDRSNILKANACDFTHSTYVIDSAGYYGTCFFSNCAISTPVSGTTRPICDVAEFQGCAPVDGTNGADILSYFVLSYTGTVQDNQNVYKATSGAQGEQDDGTDTSYSLQMDPATTVSTAFPLYTPWIATLVGSTGSKTITMKVAHTETAVLTDQDIFMEVEYMGEPGLAGTQRLANSPMSVIEVDDDCPIVTGTLSRDVLAASAANRTDDALDDWTGLTSEKEHTLTATITCDEVGYIRCRVGLTKDTTSSVYVDPKISVT